MADNDVKVAPVENYPERPYEEAKRSPEDTVLAEGRVHQTDQIADYHAKHPTLKAEGPLYDQEQVAQAVAKKATPKVSKKAAKEAAEEQGLT